MNKGEEMPPGLKGPDTALFAAILAFRIEGELEGLIDSTPGRTIHFFLTEKESGLETRFYCLPQAEPPQVHFSGLSYKKQGQGLAKQFMANRLALYDTLGTRTLLSSFAHVGAYAFAKFGFLPDQKSWDRVRLRLIDKIDGFCDKYGVPDQTKEEITAILLSDEPESMWALADHPCKVDNRAISYRMMEEAHLYWDGTFNMNNPAQMTRMRNYIGPQTLDAAMENARKVMSVSTPVQKPSASTTVPALIS